MNKKLSKTGLLFLVIINCPYLLLLISGLEPDPVGSEIVAENTAFVLISPIILILLCIAGLFIKEKNAGIYRKISKLFAALRVVFGEFGAFWLTFYIEWQKGRVDNSLSVTADADIPVHVLRAGIILLLFALPLIGNIAAMMCFEYGLEKDKRVNLHIYKTILICLSIITIIGVIAALSVYFYIICYAAS